MAVDPGIAATGYAIGKDNEVLETGVIKTYPKNGSDFERCKKISKEIEELIKKYGVEEMYIEDYKVYGNQLNFRGRKHGEKTIQVITHLQMLCERLGVYWELVNFNSWKADFKRIWTIVTLSDKPAFKELIQLHDILSTKTQDHEYDAFRMLLPKIINFKEALL